MQYQQYNLCRSLSWPEYYLLYTNNLTLEAVVLKKSEKADPRLPPNATAFRERLQMSKYALQPIAKTLLSKSFF